MAPPDPARQRHGQAAATPNRATATARSPLAPDRATRRPPADTAPPGGGPCDPGPARPWHRRRPRRPGPRANRDGTGPGNPRRPRPGPRPGPATRQRRQPRQPATPAAADPCPCDGPACQSPASPRREITPRNGPDGSGNPRRWTPATARQRPGNGPCATARPLSARWTALRPATAPATAPQPARPETAPQPRAGTARAGPLCPCRRVSPPCPAPSSTPAPETRSEARNFARPLRRRPASDARRCKCTKRACKPYTARPAAACPAAIDGGGPARTSRRPAPPACAARFSPRDLRRPPAEIRPACWTRPAGPGPEIGMPGPATAAAPAPAGHTRPPLRPAGHRRRRNRPARPGKRTKRACKPYTAPPRPPGTGTGTAPTAPPACWTPATPANPRQPPAGPRPGTTPDLPACADGNPARTAGPGPSACMLDPARWTRPAGPGKPPAARDPHPDSPARTA